MAPSLRQLKKDRTRAAVMKVSQRLFSRQGYEATTLEQISGEAEVSVPTLLVYFESKERLALAAEHDVLAQFRERIDDPERVDDTMTLWRRQVEEGTSEVSRDLRGYLERTWYLNDPALGRGVLELLTQYEDLLAAGFGRDFDRDPDADRQVRLLACTLNYGNHSVVRRWSASGGTTDLAGEALGVVDFVEAHYPRPVHATRGRRQRL